MPTTFERLFVCVPTGVLWLTMFYPWYYVLAGSSIVILLCPVLVQAWIEVKRRCWFHACCGAKDYLNHYVTTYKTGSSQDGLHWFLVLGCAATPSAAIAGGAITSGATTSAATTTAATACVYVRVDYGSDGVRAETATEEATLLDASKEKWYQATIPSTRGVWCGSTGSDVTLRKFMDKAEEFAEKPYTLQDHNCRLFVVTGLAFLRNNGVELENDSCFKCGEDFTISFGRIALHLICLALIGLLVELGLLMFTLSNSTLFLVPFGLLVWYCLHAFVMISLIKVPEFARFVLSNGAGWYTLRFSYSKFISLWFLCLCLIALCTQRCMSGAYLVDLAFTLLPINKQQLVANITTRAILTGFLTAELALCMRWRGDSELVDWIWGYPLVFVWPEHGDVDTFSKDTCLGKCMRLRHGDVNVFPEDTCFGKCMRLLFSWRTQNNVGDEEAQLVTKRKA